MKKFNFIKIVFINTIITLVLIISGMNKFETFADEGCNAAQVIDYLAEIINLGVLEDNSFEGKKQGLNKFGIEGLEYLASPEDIVTVEQLSSVCVSIMQFLDEDREIKIKNDYSDYKIVNAIDLKFGEYGKLKDEISKRNRIKKLGRINDLNIADKRHRGDIITVLKKGIFIGKSLGKYSQKRNLEPKRQVSLKEVKKAIDRTYNMEKRHPMSPDGQLIRKTNLPVNASEYKYILAAYPNSFYETRFNYENYLSTLNELHITYDPPKFTYKRLEKDWFYDRRDMFEEADKIRRFQDHRFNVDYRKIDKKWAEKLVSFYSLPNDTDKKLKGIRKEINEYIKFVKDNKLIIKAEPSSTEISAAYAEMSRLHFHEHIKFKIVSCKDLDKNLKKIIYGSWFENEPWGITKSYKEKVKLGKWIEGVYSIVSPERRIYPESDGLGIPWRWVDLNLLDNTKRNLRKKKILKQFRVTPKDKLWYDPEVEWAQYGWR